MNLMSNRLSRALTGVAASAFLIGGLVSCDDGVFDAAEDTGTFRVIMHDAPGDFQEVNVDVQRIEVNREEDEETGWTTVGEPDEVYDLLELINGAQTVLGEEELEAGTYRQIRLILGDRNTVVIDDESYDMMVPSGQQTGVKLNIDAEIESGIEYNLLLDFDAKRSVVQRGQGDYLLKPVIKATNEALTGNIDGTVEPADSRPWVYAIAGDDTLSTTRSEEDTGEFRLVGLEEGAYDVSFEPVEGYQSKTVEDVEVQVGETTDLETIEIDEDDSNDE